jgi:hypothetical protein
MAFEVRGGPLMVSPLLFRSHMKHNAERHKFMPAEDEMLRKLVDKYGETNWNLISSFMNRRNTRQCRERYKNYLSPSFRNTPWTPEEEEQLAQKVKELGPKWSVIARCFEARSDVNVKNHWASIACRNERIERYTRTKVTGASEDPIATAIDDDRSWSPWTIGEEIEESEFFL